MVRARSRCWNGSCRGAKASSSSWRCSASWPPTSSSPSLSAADATAHVLENPLVPGFLDGHQVAITLFLIALLGGVFLKGFTEAIGIAVGLVAVYLALNLVVVTVALGHLVATPAWSRTGDSC
jgi:hypothetical protein